MSERGGQKIKWVGEKVKEVDGTGFKLWYTGINKSQNGIEIMIDKSFRDKVVDVKRKGDKIILVKLVVGDIILNILSVYAPQVGLQPNDKSQFWEDLEEVLRGIPREEKNFLGGDLNDHVGKSNGGFDRIHGDDIVFIDENKDDVNRKLELWRSTLESKGFTLSRIKTEYLKCEFSLTRDEDQDLVHLLGQDVPKKEAFRYL
ncbi:uncharacterized protein LOC133288765 [Gastrolobium bilobum]|uniref:uncharacterized protein LOC133288765 n=1 Tax=Gastrolobium bilobum TaxID=150636 RepID=UPI002AAF301E|nr:uncharacterized protein LOC133288765 [Gastrolobium bilobum]